MTKADGHSVMDTSDRLRRLERRLVRERAARRAAEEIAESRTRALYETNQNLDQQIAERTAELNHALTAVTAARETTSAFLAQMSHQLKTPLNGLMGMLELIDLDTMDGPTSERLSVARRSAVRLERLVTRLILYSDLDGVDLSHTHCHRSAVDIVSDLHDRWISACLHAGQLLGIEEVTPAKVVVAHPPLDLALDEVMSNVVAHAGHGPVRLRARLVGDAGANETGCDSMSLEVFDPGPGLPADAVAGPLAIGLGSAPKTTTADRPAGLGLALIDAAIQALGGWWGPVVDGDDHGVAIHLPATAHTDSG